MQNQKSNTKKELYNSFKFHRNTLNKLTRLSKDNHYQSYFEENKNKIVKICNGIREIIHISKKSSNPKIVANTVNQFFFDIPKKIEIEIVPTAKKYHDSLLNLRDSSFFIQPATKDEVIY